jgi:phenylalanine-4-hydroxylase
MNCLIVQRLKLERDAQNFSDYQIEAYRNWENLLEKQVENIEGKAIQEFMDGLGKIKSFIQNIPNIAILSQFLKEQVGWQLFPVKGLVESDNFYYLLSQRYFPVATFVRSDSDLNYSPVPDIWHDIFGHIPLLFSTTYSEFLEFLGHKYFARKDLRKAIANLFWYTIETGTCYEKGQLRVYGGSLLSSIKDIEYAVSDCPIKGPFDLEKVIHIDGFEDRLFEIPSFGYLNVIQYEFENYFS